MHKKLEAELISLAHQILQMKNKDDVVKLKNIAKELHEKLSVLTFVNNYFLTTPNAPEDKKEILNTIENLSNLKNEVFVEKIVTEVEETNNDINIEENNIIESITQDKDVEKTIEVLNEKKLEEKQNVKIEQTKIDNDIEKNNIIKSTTEDKDVKETIEVFNEKKLEEKQDVKIEQTNIDNDLEENNIIESAIKDKDVKGTIEVFNEKKLEEKQDVKIEQTNIDNDVEENKIIESATKDKGVEKPKDLKPTTKKTENQTVKTNTSDSLANNEEFKNSIPADVAANLFEKANNLMKSKLSVSPTNEEEEEEEEEEDKVVVEKTNQPNVAKKVKTTSAPKKPVAKAKITLNDRLHNQKLQIGLNDRIAFVKHLFNYSQEDFNRVLSQLNTFETEVETIDFIKNNVKPEYDWSEKKEYEERLITLIERKFV